MITFTNSVTIHRPLSEVYAYLADLTHTPEWNRAITSTEKIAPGPVAVGTTYRQTRHDPSHSVEELRITHLEMDRLIGVEGTLGLFPARLTYQLTPPPQERPPLSTTSNSTHPAPSGSPPLSSNSGWRHP